GSCCECCGSKTCEILKGKAIANDIIENGGDYLLDTSPALLPSWYNHSEVLRGQEYFHKNVFSMFVGMLSGLLTLLTVPSILHVLRMTNRSSAPLTAYKRYLGTITNVVSWYESDLRNPNSKGRQSILSVRGQHFAASQAHGPITQKDMALTQFGFIGFAIISSKKLGLNGDQAGLIHLWRVIGHLLGIQDRGSAKCTEAVCKELVERIFGPSLDKPPKYFTHMSKSLINGVWPIIPFLSYACALEQTRRLCNLSPKRVPTMLQPLFYLQLAVHWLLNFNFLTYFLRLFLNTQIWVTLFLQTLRYPLLVYMKFGVTSFEYKIEKSYNIK
ncbi:hypothetical protein AAG570_007624, partial [Ranatra chinensis]